MKSIAQVVSAAGLVAMVVSLSACTITRKPDGTIEVRESNNSATDGVYTRVNIGGRCYLSNGTYCIPCGGGKALTCEEVRRVLGDTPWTEPQQKVKQPAGNQPAPAAFEDGGETLAPPSDASASSVLSPSATMLWSVNALMNGLSAQELAESLSLDTWQPGSPHKTVFSLNALDSEAKSVDFTYISAWGASAPAPGIHPNGVTVEYYVLGDLTDNIRDAVAVRISGPWDAAADVAAAIGSFQGQITTEFGDFAVNFGENGNAVRWNGTTVWTH